MKIRVAKAKLSEIRKRLLAKAPIDKKPDWHNDFIDLCVMLEWALKEMELTGDRDKSGDCNFVSQMPSPTDKIN